jgi:hypothetical protein
MRRGLPLLLLLPLLLASPDATIGEEPPPNVVLGTGDRLSGTLPILVLDPGRRGAPEALTRFVEQIEARSDLKVPVRLVGKLGPTSAREPVIVLLGRPSPDDRSAVRHALTLRRSAVLASADVAPAMGHRSRGLRERWPPLEPTGPLPVLIGDPTSPEDLLETVRFALRHGRGVRHVPTAFAAIAADEEEGGSIAVEVKTALPGEVTLSAIDVTGKELLAEGPLRPLPASLRDGDPHAVLVRLRFRGEAGLREEARIWLPSLLPELLPRIRVHGSHRLAVDEPVVLRITVEDADGGPLEGYEVAARHSTAQEDGATDATGSVVLELPALNALPKDGLAPIRLEVRGPHLTRTYETTVPVEEAPRAAVLEIDRPVHRPGGLLRMRGLVVDPRDRSGRKDVAARIVVRDPRRRMVGSVEGRTDRFGAITGKLPLADGILLGKYEATLTGEGFRAKRVFRIEEVERPEIEVTVRLDRSRVPPGESIRGAVEIGTFDGEPLSGTRVEIEVGRETVWKRKKARAIERFAFPAPREGTVRLVARVSHEGAEGLGGAAVRVAPPARPRILLRPEPEVGLAGVPSTLHLEVRDEESRLVDAEVEIRGVGDEPLSVATRGGRASLELPALPRGLALDLTGVATLTNGKKAEGGCRVLARTGVRLTTPEAVAPGADLEVGVLATEKEAAVRLDLVAQGRLLAATTLRLVDGRGRARFAVPRRVRGPATILAHGPAGEARREILVADPDLRVSLAPGRLDAAPGESVDLDVRVSRAGQGGTAALLDVRVVDEAYRAIVGPVTADPIGGLSGKRETRPAAVLVEDLGTTAWATLERRLAAAARPALEAAAKSLVAGRRPEVTAPWGERLRLSRTGRGTRLGFGPAVTHLPDGRRAVLPAAPETVAWGVSGAGRFPAREILSGARAHPEGGVGGTFGGRRGRRNLRAEGGGGTQGAVDQGLLWLERHQAPDGTIRPDRFHERCEGDGCDEAGDPALHPGTTALAVLAWAGAGETHRSGRHRDAVRAALRALVERQGPDGFIGDPHGPYPVLNHTMATLALTELYALTGSPLVERPAQRAVDALVRRQRADGGFSEPGWGEGGLSLATWAAMALKSARAGGLRIDPAPFTRLLAWLDARTVRGTGLARLAEEEVAGYPFGELRRLRTRAAMTALIRLHLVGDLRSEPMLRAARLLLDDLPEYDDGLDYHGVWLGSAAAFQIGGELWRAWNVAMKTAIIDHRRKSGCVRGSWDDGRGTLGRAANTAFGTLCLETYYRYSRVFGTGDRHARRPRSEFPDLALVDLARRTDHAGEATVDLDLPDSVTTWGVLVGAWDGQGGYGRATGSVRALLPLHLSLDLPERLVVGDVVEVPVRIRSTLRQAATCALEVEVTGCEIVAPIPAKVTVPPRGLAAAKVRLRAGPPGPVRFVARVRAGEREDAIERRSRVLPRGVPFRMARFLPLGEATGLADRLPDDAKHLAARLVVSAGKPDDATRALRGLIRRPTGCFEQTSATLYPALLAYRVLEESGDATVAGLRYHLVTGYQRILGFEVEGGGFSLYGEPPPILSSRPSASICCSISTRWSRSTRTSSHGPRGSSRDISRAGRSDASRRSGALRRVEKRELPTGLVDGLLQRGDPFLVALAVNHGLVGEGQRARARKLLESRTEPRIEGAAWRSDARDLFASAGEAHVTAVVVRALGKLDGPEELVAGGLRTVREARHPDGAWRTTRATVAALQALVEIGPADLARGKLRILRDGKPAREAMLQGTRLEVFLGDWRADDQVTVAFEGEGVPWATLVVDGVTTVPLSGVGPLDLAVAWPASPAPRGRSVSVAVTVENRSPAEVVCPMVEIRIPAGVTVDATALEKAAARAGFSRAEVRDGRIGLYLHRLGGGREEAIEIPVRARFVGRCQTGPARAYPYYEPERATIRAGTTIAVVAED